MKSGLMGRSAEPSIDVAISQELRDLVAGRQMLHRHSITQQFVGVAEAPAPCPTETVPLAGLTPITLRRDADRPLKFDGLPVLSFSDPLSLGDVRCHHCVTVYASKQGECYLSLTLGLHSHGPMRSLYRAFAVQPETLSEKLADWHDTILSVAQIVTAFSPEDARLQDIRDAVQRTISHGFHLKKL